MLKYLFNWWAHLQAEPGTEGPGHANWVHLDDSVSDPPLSQLTSMCHFWTWVGHSRKSRRCSKTWRSSRCRSSPCRWRRCPWEGWGSAHGRRCSKSGPRKSEDNRQRALNQTPGTSFKEAPSLRTAAAKTQASCTEGLCRPPGGGQSDPDRKGTPTQAFLSF